MLESVIRTAWDGPPGTERLCRSDGAGAMVQVVPVIDRPALVDACETCLDFAAGLELRGGRWTVSATGRIHSN